MMNCDALLAWLDQDQAFYFLLVGGLIVVALVLAILPLLRDHAGEKREHDWGWGALVLAILAAGRWPSIFFPREINPDEGQLLAGAHALLHDPVFWRSVDGGTAGPLDFFALWPAGAVFGWQTYFTARITALLLVAITLIMAHQCIALIWGRKVARVAGLAAVCLEALTNTVDLLHYSTELMSMALLTAAAYAAIRRWVYQGGLIWYVLGGLLLGAVPLAKLQAMPLAAGMGLGWLLAEVFSKEPNATHRILCLLAGAFLPVTLFAGQITITGEWENVIIPYFYANVEYTKQGVTSPLLLLGTMLDFSIRQDSLLHLWLPGSIVWLVLMLRLRHFADQAARVFTLASFAAFLLALICVYYPGNPALHYWQIAVAPCAFLLGAMTGNLLSTSPQSSRKRDRWLVAVCAFSLVGTLLVHRAWTPNSFMGYRAFFQHHPHTKLVSRLISQSRPGDSIAIWGWTNYVYVETGLRQAVRDGDFPRSFEVGSYCQFYRKRFLADLVSAKPTFFLDSTGPYNSIYKIPELAHDKNFPELAAVIKANYILSDEVVGARLYRRRDPATH